MTQLFSFTSEFLVLSMDLKGANYSLRLSSMPWPSSLCCTREETGWAMLVHAQGQCTRWPWIQPRPLTPDRCCPTSNGHPGWAQTLKSPVCQCGRVLLPSLVQTHTHACTHTHTAPLQSPCLPPGSSSCCPNLSPLPLCALLSSRTGTVALDMLCSQNSVLCGKGVGWG